MKLNYINIIISVIILFVSLASCNTTQNDFSERTKIALRDAGNKLLLSNQDSTSLILPIKQVERDKYLISFNNSLSFEPNSLVTSVQESFESTHLPSDYRVEVVQCSDREVAYSYQITNEEESTLIPCASRYLPTACYFIEVKFTNRPAANFGSEYIFALSIIVILFGFCFWVYKRNNGKAKSIKDVNYKAVGSFRFYPEQNKLIKATEEIALSKKECELLTLFVERPNEIIKRDELTKKVWEDNGVFVGRSLDTYISKLRKKLQSDTSVKLSNVHGVGYKLQLEYI